MKAQPGDADFVGPINEIVDGNSAKFADGRNKISWVNNDKGNKKIPYWNSRPKYAAGQEEQVWQNAQEENDGNVYDPSGERISWDRTKPRKGQWDMGHLPGQKYSDKHKDYLENKLSKEEFLKWYRDPLNYRPELPKTNRGHKYE